MSQSIISAEAVIEEVKKAIAETLNINKDTIKPESSLMKDLGAESLDFLDINYRLEQAFGAKMARHFVLEHMEEMFGEGTAIDENSCLTEKAISVLKIRLGENVSSLTPGMDMDEVPAMVTVQSIANGVIDVINSLPEKCHSCGSQAWGTDNGIRIKCSSCGEYAVFTNGDDLIKTWLNKVQEEKNIF